MSDYQRKRYYWLKLKEDFFKSHEVVILESLPNGYAYESFYLKLLLESISHEGMLRYNNTIPYDESMLASITHMDIDIVRSALKVLISMELIELLDDGTYHMMQVHEMIGSETHDAERKRKELAERKERGQIEDKRGNFPQEYRDKRLDNRDINNIYSPVSQEKTEHYASEIFEVISYLNEKTGKRYRESNNKNQTLIKARLKEGYTVEDFKKVIDNKVSEWSNDSKMEQYLRPVTLFGTKFESYLNQKPVVEGRSISKENADFLAAIMED